MDAGFISSPEEIAEAGLYNNQGWELLRQQQWEVAKQSFMQALRLEPDLLNALDGIATALIRLGEFEAALHRVFRAMEIQPDAERMAIAGYAFMCMDRVIEALVLLGTSCALSSSPKPHWREWLSQTREKFAAKYSDVVSKDVCRLIEKKEDGTPVVEPAPIHPNASLIKYKGKFVSPQQAWKTGAKLVEQQKVLEANRLVLAVALMTLTPEVATDLGVIAHLSRRYNEALRFYLLALWIKPDCYQAISNLGAALARASAGGVAVWLLRLLTRIDPNSAQSWGNLAASLCQERKYPQEAERAARHAMTLKKDNDIMAVNLAYALREQGRVDEAAEVLLSVSSQFKKDERVRSSLLLTRLYQYGMDRHIVAEEHKAFGQDLEAPYRKYWRKHGNDRDPDRRLRIGFISPDFVTHPVANFIDPWWRNYDQSEYDFYAYHNLVREDETTARLKTYVPHWRNVSSMDDVALDKCIREDKIDILFDLAGHTANHRLAVFARRPAPVQVGFLGYPHTTGMRAMDWRFVDPGLNVDDVQQFYTEKLIQLPVTANCYQPSVRFPERADSIEFAVRDTPALQNGYVTFGCCNNFAKINSMVIAVWSSILLNNPGSKLLIESVGLDNDEQIAAIERIFMHNGVQPDRLRLLTRQPQNQYVLYHQIDIALDPFPYNGGTTNVDLLWMGVPLVTLLGNSEVSCMGSYFLRVLDRSEWIARSESEYVSIASRLCQSYSSLDGERKKLNADFKGSPLMDGSAYAKDFSMALRRMWRAWCEKPRGNE